MPFLFNFGTASFRRRVLDIIPFKFIRRVRDVADTIKRCSKEVFEEKKRALDKGDEAMHRQSAEDQDILSVLRPYLL